MLLSEIYDLKKEQATEELLERMGWEYHSPRVRVDGMKRKMIAFINMCRKMEEEHGTEFVDKINFSAWNKDDVEYPKTFSRVVLSDGEKAFTIICNMTGAGARYRVFKTGDPEPLEKIRSRKKMAEFLERNFA